MSKSNFNEEIKRDAVRQITERGYPVAEVSQQLGVSQHSLYEWKKKFAASNTKGNDEAEEIRRLKKELARVTEERDILKMITGFSPPVRGRNRWRYDSRRRRVADCLLEAFDPVKKRGTWAVAKLRVVTRLRR